MLKFKKQSKIVIIISSVLASIVLLLLIIQYVLGNILDNRLENILSDREDNQYSIDIGNVKVNLFTMTLILKDVSVIPDSGFVNNIKSGHAKQKIAYRLSIPVIRIRNIGLIDLVKNQYIDVSIFIIKNAKVELTTSGNKSDLKLKQDDPSESLFDVDSIVLPGISGVDISKFVISNLGINVIDISSSDTLFSVKSIDISFDEVVLTKNKFDSTSFSLTVLDADVVMTNEQFHLPRNEYLFSCANMKYNMKEARLVFNNLKVEPLFSRAKMVGMSKFTHDIFNLEIEQVEVNSIHPLKIIRDSKMYLSNVVVDKMKLSIFKDKRCPFDTKKRPKLPQQMLKSLKQDIYIDSITINESVLVYSEKHKNADALMAISMSSLNAKIKNITSVHDSIIAGTIMTIKLLADIENKVPMGVDIYFPMQSVADTFSFNGWLSKADLKLFNPIVIPVLGSKFKNGIIDGISFKAQGNPTYTIGEMTMLYHDLQGVIVKNNTEESKKFLSWVAKHILIRNNPGKGEENRTVPMFFNRVQYKGLGNFIWKTLQSGITATIVPTMEKQVQKNIDVALGMDKKTIRKREKEEKQKNKKKRK